MNTTFYVYVIFRKSGVPCYVGKGNGGRWQRHVTNSGNPHLRNIYAKAAGALPIIKVRAGLTEAEAFETERVLIAAIGREVNGGPLVNLTAGGDGVTGYRHSSTTKALGGARSRDMWADPDHRSKIIAAQAAGKATPEFHANRSAASTKYAADPSNRKRMSESGLARYADPQAREKTSATTKAAMAQPDVKARTSEAQKQRFADPAQRARLRANSLGRVHSPEERAKRAASLVGGKRTPEQRAKMSAWQVGRVMSDEARAKMSAAAKARCAKAKKQTELILE